MGLIETLTILFVALKLCHVIDWTWSQVLLPELIMLGIYAIIFIAFMAWSIVKIEKEGL